MLLSRRACDMPYLTAGSERIFYAARGRPKDTPVVFVHGAGGNHLVWGYQLAGLASASRPIALDLPGHGRSGTQGRQSVAEYAGVLVSFLEGLSLSRVIVVGHSMGGAIALTVALEHPALLRALVLVDTGARLRVAPAILGGAPADFASTVRLIGDYAFGPGALQKVRRLSEQASLRTGPTTLRGDFVACDGFDVMGRLGEIRIPTVVLCGSEDRLTPLKYATYLGEHIVGARVVTVPGAGHMLMLEQPEAVIKAIMEVLDANA